ncbi:hypothetical protein D3C79_992400 [compost metagenome]
MNACFKECRKPPGELFYSNILQSQVKVAQALLLLLPELADRCLDALPVRERCLGQWVARTGRLGPAVDCVAHLLALIANACKPVGKLCGYIHGNTGCLGALVQQQTL